jgi:predicted transposase YdaD
MNSLGYKYPQSEFVRRHFGEGKAEGLIEGRMEGRVDLILELLAKRFGPLSDNIQTRVRCAQDAQLSAVTERMLTAQTLEQALASLY